MKGNHKNRNNAMMIDTDSSNNIDNSNDKDHENKYDNDSIK